MENKITHINGDAGFYTGASEVLHSGVFYHVKMTEGRFAGKTKVTQRAPNGINPNDAIVMAEWKAQQADFAKLHRS